MPRSLITSLTHSNASKRVTNPRVTTLLRIVDFFRADGFDITIEDLLGLQQKTIDITKEKIIPTHVETISVYSLNNKKLGTVKLNLSFSSKNITSLYINKDIPPFFKAGSIFIINNDLKPENGNLIALTLNYSEQIIIRKCFLSKNKMRLLSLENEEDIM